MRYRISWATSAGLVTAVEPTPDEIRAHATALARGYNDPANAALMFHFSLLYLALLFVAVAVDAAVR